VSNRNDAMLAAALEYAEHHWAVFPLRGKIPAIPKRIGGRGMLDATLDVDQVAEWWSGRYAGCNIGGRVPASMFVLDVDPRNGGLASLAALVAEHGKLPETLTTLSGRGDGGMHLFYRRPAGALSATRLGPGIDIKTSSGYVVLSPSIHPDSGQRYARFDRPVAAPPAWLIELITEKPEKTPRAITPARPRTWRSGRLGGSIADQYSANTSWVDVLGPHHWTCDDPDPDADGAVWLHPAHTSTCSATVRHGCLFVWSTSTVFVSKNDNGKGYTRFRAYALLNHNGDMSAAARSLRGA
jgi:Bifunctional DNA primase/polymerase, N-terminal